MMLKYNVRTRANTIPTTSESIGNINTKFLKRDIQRNLHFSGFSIRRVYRLQHSIKIKRSQRHNSLYAWVYTQNKFSR